MTAFDLYQTEDQKLKKLIWNCLVFSLVWHLIAAWFSIGYHQADEHFQIIEFASWKMGNTPQSALTWEFGARIRPALQPAMVVFIQKYVAPWGNPAQISFLLRLFSALIGFGSMVLILFISLKMVDTYESKRFLVLLSNLFWFIPYIHAHFSAESISGSLFFIGLGSIFYANEKKKKYLLFLGGFLTGLAFDCRPQTAFMIFGLALWCIFIARMKIGSLFRIGVPVLVAIGIGVLIDKWFYGEWVFTAWNYFKVNIIQGKASEFGVSPWYKYFYWNFIDLIPPFSLFILAGIIYSLIKYRTNIFSLAVIPFLLVHIIVAHKEPRFLFPAIGAAPLLLALVYRDFDGRYFKNVKIKNTILNLFFGLNIIMMAISCFKPASDRVGLYQYLYKQYNGKKAMLICRKDNPYEYGENSYFYRIKDIAIVKIATNQGIDSVINTSTKRPLLVLFSKQGEADTFAAEHPDAKIVYANIPKWSEKYNYFNWVSRTSLWVLFEVKE